MTGAWGRPGQRGPLPLVVDVDGALLKRNLTTSILRDALWNAPLTLKAQWQAGRADLCAQALAELLPDQKLVLDLSRDMLSLIATHQRLGGEVFLLGQAQGQMLAALAQHLQIRARILGGDPDQGMPRSRQLRVIAAMFPARGYLFAGSARASLDLSMGAREAMLVDAPASLKGRFLTFGGKLTVLPVPVWLPIDLQMRRLSGADLPAGAVESANQLASRAIWAAETEKARPLRDAPETRVSKRRA